MFLVLAIVAMLLAFFWAMVMSARICAELERQDRLAAIRKALDEEARLREEKINRQKSRNQTILANLYGGAPPAAAGKTP